MQEAPEVVHEDLVVAQRVVHFIEQSVPELVTKRLLQLGLAEV